MNIYIQNNQDGTLSYYYKKGSMKIYVTQQVYREWLNNR